MHERSGCRRLLAKAFGVAFLSPRSRGEEGLAFSVSVKMLIADIRSLTSVLWLRALEVFESRCSCRAVVPQLRNEGYLIGDTFTIWARLRREQVHAPPIILRNPAQTLPASALPGFSF